MVPAIVVGLPDALGLPLSLPLPLEIMTSINLVLLEHDHASVVCLYGNAPNPAPGYGYLGNYRLAVETSLHFRERERRRERRGEIHCALSQELHSMKKSQALRLQA